MLRVDTVDFFRADLQAAFQACDADRSGEIGPTELQVGGDTHLNSSMPAGVVRAAAE